MTLPFEVLVVDDDGDLRSLLVDYLRELGLNVTAATTGEAAIVALRRSPSLYRLIITDLQLPGADGLAVLAAAKEVQPAIHVVIITGYATIDSAIEAVRHGAYDYLPKPFSLGQIEVIVQRVADRFALEEENRVLARRLAGDATPAKPWAPPPWLAPYDARLARVESLLRDVLQRLEYLTPS